MKVTITPTDRIVTIDGETPCRIWQGTTEKGTRVFAYVRALAVPAQECDDEEMQELIEIMAVEDPEIGTAHNFGLATYEETEFKG